MGTSKNLVLQMQIELKQHQLLRFQAHKGIKKTVFRSALISEFNVISAVNEIKRIFPWQHGYCYPDSVIANSQGETIPVAHVTGVPSPLHVAL